MFSHESVPSVGALTRVVVALPFAFAQDTIAVSVTAVILILTATASAITSSGRGCVFYFFLANTVVVIVVGFVGTSTVHVRDLVSVVFILAVISNSINHTCVSFNTAVISNSINSPVIVAVVQIVVPLPTFVVVVVPTGPVHVVKPLQQCGVDTPARAAEVELGCTAVAVIRAVVGVRVVVTVLLFVFLFFFFLLVSFCLCLLLGLFLFSLRLCLCSGSFLSAQLENSAHFFVHLFVFFIANTNSVVACTRRLRLLRMLLLSVGQSLATIQSRRVTQRPSPPRIRLLHPQLQQQ